LVVNSNSNINSNNLSRVYLRSERADRMELELVLLDLSPSSLVELLLRLLSLNNEMYLSPSMRQVLDSVVEA